MIMDLAEDLGLISLPQSACELAWPINQLLILLLFQRPEEATNSQTLTD